MADYLNNKTFTDTILLYRLEPEQHKDELAEMLTLLASKLVRRYRFALCAPEDCIQECVLTCFAKVHRFDVSVGSKAFNFFTTVMLNHMRQMYRTEQNYLNLKIKFTEHCIETKKIVVPKGRKGENKRYGINRLHKSDAEGEGNSGQGN